MPAPNKRSTKNRQKNVDSPENPSCHLLSRVLGIYRSQLADCKKAQTFLRDKQWEDVDFLERHQLGYCPGRLIELLPQEKQDPALWKSLYALGIFQANGREALADCLVVPLFELDSTLCGLCGIPIQSASNLHRSLAGQPVGMWNAPVLQRFSEVVLVDDLLEGLSLEATGVHNVIALTRAEGFSDTEIEWLRGSQIQHIHYLRLKSGLLEQAETTLQTQLRGIGWQSFVLPGEMCPHAFLKARGPEKLAQSILAATRDKPRPVSPQNIQPLEDGFEVNLGSRRYQVRGLDKGPRKLRATVRVEQAGKLHVDTLDFYSARWRRQMIADVARIFEQPAQTVEAEVMKVIQLCENQIPNPQVQAKEMFLSPKAREQAEAFAKDPDLIKHILADYQECGLVGEQANKLLYYLAAVSRKMDHPLSVMTLSSSGAGKSTLQDSALQFCPPEDLVKVTILSGKALFYKDQTSLKHKVLALEEDEGMSSANYAIRNLVSAGYLVIETAVKDAVTGKLTTRENRVEGPTAVFLTTTNPDVDPETQSRFFVTSVDEGRQQTQAILQFQRQEQTLAGLRHQEKRRSILEKHQNFQRLLQPLAVINPYADQLTYGDGRLQSRRDQPRYLNLIRSVAFLRQMQKTVHPVSRKDGEVKGYIEVDKEDIKLANDLAHNIMGHSLDELSGPGHALLMNLESMTKETSPTQPDTLVFTRRQIREYTGWSHARVHRYLKELLTLEYVLMVGGRFGYAHRYCLAYQGQGKNGQRFLLGLKSIDDLTQPVSPRCTTISREFHSTARKEGAGAQADKPNSFQKLQKT